MEGTAGSASVSHDKKKTFLADKTAWALTLTARPPFRLHRQRGLSLRDEKTPVSALNDKLSTEEVVSLRWLRASGLELSRFLPLLAGPTAPEKLSFGLLEPQIRSGELS